MARTEPFGHEVGDSVTFTLLDLDRPSTYEVIGTIRAITDHAYFFVQDGTSYSESALERIAADFEGEVWPRVTAAFGEPWTPGVDGDPRITLLHADLRGVGGYVTGADSFPRDVAPASNEREMLYIDRSVLAVPGVDYNDLVAHELQHLITATPTRARSPGSTRALRRLPRSSSAVASSGFRSSSRTPTCSSITGHRLATPSRTTRLRSSSSPTCSTTTAAATARWRS